VAIEIEKPELEAPFLAQTKNGNFQNVEDFLLDALQTSLKLSRRTRSGEPQRKSLVQIFAESPLKWNEQICCDPRPSGLCRRVPQTL